jgi:pyrroloquinoline quinone biosynthesis protein B
MLRIIVLGSAAGGGFPQWNSNDGIARRVRAGDRALRARTQSSIAVSSDGKRWVLFNASPDLRQQINERSILHPAEDGPKRATPVAAVVLTNADVDHVTGLLSLRENQAFGIYAHTRVLDVLQRNSIFNVLNPACVRRHSLDLEERTELFDPLGDTLQIWVRGFEVPGKIALWLEDLQKADFGTEPGDTIGVEISDSTGVSFFYIPGCAAFPPELGRRLHSARLVLFDGTLWQDDEMITQGVGTKTGRRMGHMSCSGADGSIATFGSLDVKRKVFIHINNTNPLLIEGSPQSREAATAGWEIAYDGMELAL